MTVLNTLRPALADRYQLVGEIGAGGMATVYLAHDIRHDRKVAIKVLRPELGAVLGAERFLSEIKVTANLQHPNLLPLFDSGEANGLLYYVMPFVEGETLRAKLERETQLPVDEVTRIVGLLASALDFAHQQGVVHRDLKPENILMQAGQPMIADFGISLAVKNAGGARITQTGLSLGTPHYMSPEQATGEKNVDARSDQYSLAAVAYEMLVGEPPHNGPNSQAIIARLMTEKPRSARQTRESVPQSMDDALMRALSKLPADRFASCGDFAAAFRATGHTTATTAGRMAQKSSAGIWAGAAIVLVALAAGWYFTSQRGGGSAGVHSTRIYVADATVARGTDLDATAAAATDAIVRGIGTLAWATVSSPPVGSRSKGDPLIAAQKERAATAISTAVIAAGDSALLQIRVLDAATGAVLRALPSVRVAKIAPPDEIARAVEPAVVAAGFISSRHLGAATLPSGTLPDLATFKLYESTYPDFAAPDRASSARMFETLTAVVDHNPNFAQARLWLGFVYWWNNFARSPSGAARADTILNWTNEGRTNFTQYEAALANFTRAATQGSSEFGLDDARRLAALVPNSPIALALPILLSDLNHPREARTLTEARIRNQGDSAKTGDYLRLAQLDHFLSDNKAELDACIKARRIASEDVFLLECELTAHAALGDSAMFLKRLDEMPTAAGDGRAFAFSGNVYLTVGQELIAHGHPQLAEIVFKRALDWYANNQPSVDRSVNVAFRKAILLTIVNREDEALALLRTLMARDTTDSRVRGYIGRILARRGDVANLAPIVSWLKALPAVKLQGAPTYELASIEANRGPSRWPEALRLLDESLREGQGFGIRHRLHYFQDWMPLKNDPAYKRILEPKG
jgi:tetratricopeptide (TPR) repeat protein